MMEDKGLDLDEIQYWTNEARQSNSVASALRRLGEVRGLDRFQLSSVAADLFPEKISGRDRQVIWKWKHADSDEGFSDAEVDELLAHLLT
jgi:hypothetical protein